MNMFVGRIALTLGASLALALPSAAAFADNIANTVDGTIDTTVEVMPLTVGGAVGTTTLVVDATNGDGKSGCNLTGSTALTVSVSSSAAAVATVSPGSLTFGSCGDVKTLTITPKTQGSTTISLTEVSNSTTATFNLAPATFRVDVAAATPANTAPTVSVTGFVNNATYEAGVDTLPTPGCTATDAEDGVQHPVPVIDDQRDTWGLGSVKVTCTYRDAGGLQAVSSASYSVIDTVAPQVTAVTRTPANGSGWNNGPVTVSWTCTDAGSGPVSATGSATVTAEGSGQSVTADCADHAGHTASRTVSDINIDTTAPVTTMSRTPASGNTGGWNNEPVTVSWTCTDTGSGVPDDQSAGQQILSADGADQSATGSCTDRAGNTSDGTVAHINIDTTPPVIQIGRDPEAGTSTWNTTSVRVTWTCTDATSGVTDAGDQQIIGDGADQSVTGTCTDLAGNTSTGAISHINVDTTPPVIHMFRNPEANASGWNNTSVLVSWTCTDATSGVTDAGGEKTLGEGADQSVTRTCTDRAGNTSQGTVTGINVDTTSPDVTVQRDPAANASGWNNGPVTVSWTCTDAGSGPVSGGGTETVTAEGSGQTVTAHCADHAGNTASQTVSDINIDTTAPAVHMTRDPEANASGWNNTSVLVSWTCTDATSGVTDAGGQQSVGEGADQSVTRTCTDRAGNTSTASISHINVDTTAPVIVWSADAISDGAVFDFGGVPGAPSCSASDALSMVDGACTVTGWSAAVGNHVLTARATDKAGNTATSSRSYTVRAWTLKGYYQPVDMGGVWNSVKGGATVPLKFEAFAGQREITDVTTLGARFTVTQVSCGSATLVDDIELTTTGGTSLRYDATAGQFIQNWQTPKAAGSCYRVTTTSADGSALAALFKLK